MINNVVDFGDSLAKDVMVPRIDIVFASIDDTYDELAAVFMEEKYSRIPVYENSKDNVIGIVNLKDLYCYHGITSGYCCLPQAIQHKLSHGYYETKYHYSLIHC